MKTGFGDKSGLWAQAKYLHLVAEKSGRQEIPHCNIYNVKFQLVQANSGLIE